MEQIAGQIRLALVTAGLKAAARLERLERLERASGGDRDHAERVAADVDRLASWRDVDKPDLDGYGGFQR